MNPEFKDYLKHLQRGAEDLLQADGHDDPDPEVQDFARKLRLVADGVKSLLDEDGRPARVFLTVGEESGNTVVQVLGHTSPVDVLVLDTQEGVEKPLTREELDGGMTEGNYRELVMDAVAEKVQQGSLSIEDINLMMQTTKTTETTN